MSDYCNCLDINKMININTIKNTNYIQNITSLYDSFRTCRDIFQFIPNLIIMVPCYSHFINLFIYVHFTHLCGNCR